MKTEFIVIVSRVLAGDNGFSFTYSWDGRRFPCQEEAINHGFETQESDDFNIGRVRGSTLTGFGWMGVELYEGKDDLNGISEQLMLDLGPDGSVPFQ